MKRKLLVVDYWGKAIQWLAVNAELKVLDITLTTRGDHDLIGCVAAMEWDYLLIFEENMREH